MTVAKFSNKCPGCGEHISKGDEIYLLDDEWVCERCREEYLEEAHRIQDTLPTVAEITRALIDAHAAQKR